MYGNALAASGASASTSNTKAASPFRRLPAGRNGVSGVPIARTAALARPSRPQGRTTSTTAITTNSATSVKRLSDKPMPKIVTCPIPMHSALISAISNAATNAPGIEPMPAS